MYFRIFRKLFANIENFLQLDKLSRLFHTSGCQSALQFAETLHHFGVCVVESLSTEFEQFEGSARVDGELVDVALIVFHLSQDAL